jgi:hypothetical protein
MSRLLDTFFGCAHRRYTFPITIRPGQQRVKAAELTGTYVVCLDCAREFGYDWDEMKVIFTPRKEQAAKVSREITESAA